MPYPSCMSDLQIILLKTLDALTESFTKVMLWPLSPEILVNSFSVFVMISEIILLANFSEWEIW